MDEDLSSIILHKSFILQSQLVTFVHGILMSGEHLQIQVECYAGYQSEETPRSFYFGKHKIHVEEIIDRWLAPDHRYFKLRGDDDGIYIIRYDVAKDFWELTMFNRGGFDETKLSST